jgi:hypothetical protein
MSRTAVWWRTPATAAAGEYSRACSAQRINLYLHDRQVERAQPPCVPRFAGGVYAPLDGPAFDGGRRYDGDGLCRDDGRGRGEQPACPEASMDKPSTNQSRPPACMGGWRDSARSPNLQQRHGLSRHGPKFRLRGMAAPVRRGSRPQDLGLRRRRVRQPPKVRRCGRSTHAPLHDWPPDARCRRDRRDFRRHGKRSWRERPARSQASSTNESSALPEFLGRGRRSACRCAV